MHTQLAYPRSAYEPSPLINLNEQAERERLSPAALRAFFNIMEKWAIRDSDARNLLGGVSNGVFYDMKKNPNRTLGVDGLARVSLLIGIFKSLNILYPADLADAWVSLPNKNRIFDGGKPLAYMLQGGLEAISVVRRLLDARRGGH